MRKPRILISAPKEGGANYVHAVERAGATAVPVYCPQADESGYDGLVLCGGGDLDDRYTGGLVNPAPSEVDPDRDRAELALIPLFLAARKPILGICRGHQVINAALGGTLIPDLPAASRAIHTGQAGKDRIHPVRTEADSFVGRLYGTASRVNSSHHQAVDRLADGLRAVQWSEDGVVEALEHRSAPVWGVQWHPERLDGPEAEGGRLFQAFLELARRGSGPLSVTMVK